MSTRTAQPPGSTAKSKRDLDSDSRHESLAGRVPPLPHRKRTGAFTLIEVMIACGIFFMATFAILALVSQTLRNARALQQGEVDVGMAAAQVFQTLRTNRLESGSLSGDFGETYRDFSWEAMWDIDFDAGATNSLLKVDIVVNRRGNRTPIDATTIWVFAPDARSGGPGR
jgi:type II secretory pathway pseudopilin PulG